MKHLKTMVLLGLLVIAPTILTACIVSSPETPDATSTEPNDQKPTDAAVLLDNEGPVDLPTEEVKSGRLTIKLAESPYIKGNVIIATVANGLEQAIYSADMKSDCAPVTLEKQDDAGNWQAVLNCAMERAPFAISIEPGQGYIITLDPNSTHFTDGVPDAGPGIDVGTYRLVFSYRLQPGREGEETEAVRTDPFLVIP